MHEIDRLNQKLNGIVVLKAMEVDILPDGTLDMPDEILEKLDLTICSIHSKFNLSKEAQTQRILKAMDNCKFTIFGHPIGRLLGERRGIDARSVFDFEDLLFGIDQARRGWLEKKDVLNTRSLKDLRRLLRLKK